MSELSALIKKINKDLGNDRIDFGVPQKCLDRIPFSSPRLNYMLYGGLPMARITEFSGEESSGKSTTALDVIKNYQKLPDAREVVWVDVEGTFDNYWATVLGVDVSKVRIFDPEVMCAEDIFGIVLDMVRTKEVGLLVIDSIPALVPNQVFEESYDKAEMGGIAKVLTRFLRDLHPLCIANNCAVILLNQVRDNFGYAGGTVTPGGRALRHFCSVRLNFKQGDLFDCNGNKVSKYSENPTGHLVNVNILKTKICSPNRKCGCYTLNYLTGIDYLSDTIDCAINMGIIIASGAWYKLVDFNTGELTDIKFQGRKSVITYYKENPEEFNKLYNKVSEEIVKS